MTDHEIAREYAQRLREKLGNHVKSIVLFGSRARGEAKAGSDWDVLVVLDGADPALEQATLAVGCDMIDRYEALFAPLTWTADKWERMRQFPIGWNIQRDGIPL